MSITFNQDGSFSGKARHDVIYTHGSTALLAVLKFPGYYSCEDVNILTWVRPDEPIKYALEYFNTDELSESQKKTIIEKMKSFVEQELFTEFCYDYNTEDRLGCFKKAKR